MNINHTADSASWVRSNLVDGLIISFCATGVVLSGLYLRMPLHLPGHRVLPLAFFLLLGRTSASRSYAGTAIGLLSGGLALSVGLEPHGLMHGVKYMIAGGIIDAAYLLVPLATTSWILGALAGGIAGASWLPIGLAFDRITGIDADVTLRFAWFKIISAICFGVAGGAIGPALTRRLRDRDRADN